jgi:hypothetical protein
VPLVVRLEGTNVELGKKILADSGLPIISSGQHGRSRQKVVAAAKGGTDHGDPDRQEHPGDDPGHHRQDRPVPYQVPVSEYANGKAATWRA